MQSNDIELSEYDEPGMYKIIKTDDYIADTASMERYRKLPLPVGCVRAMDILPEGTPVNISTLEGNIKISVQKDIIIIIGIKGEVYPIRLEKFSANYQVLDKKYVYSDCVIADEYRPQITNCNTGEVIDIAQFAKECIPIGNVNVYVKKLDAPVRIYSSWDRNSFLSGKKGDYLAVKEDDLSDVYIVESEIFNKTYTGI